MLYMSSDTAENQVMEILVDDSSLHDQLEDCALIPLPSGYSLDGHRTVIRYGMGCPKDSTVDMGTHNVKVMGCRHTSGA